MKNRMMTLAGTLPLLAVLGNLSVPPLLAQVRPALVKNVDEPGRSPYQVLPVSSTDCGTYTYLNFPAVPSGKRLVITFASGVVYTPQNSPANARLTSSNGPIARAREILPARLHFCRSQTKSAVRIHFFRVKSNSMSKRATRPFFKPQPVSIFRAVYKILQSLAI